MDNATNTDNKKVLRVTVAGRGRFALHTPYSRGLVWRFKKAVDEAHGRRKWTGEHWLVDARGVHAARTVYEGVGYTTCLAQGVPDALVEAEQAPWFEVKHVAGGKALLTLRAPFHSGAREVFRAIPGVRWGRHDRVWTFPSDWVVFDRVADGLLTIWPEVAAVFRAAARAHADALDAASKPAPAAPVVPAPAVDPAGAWGIWVVVRNGLAPERFASKDGAERYIVANYPGHDASGLPAALAVPGVRNG